MTDDILLEFYKDKKDGMPKSVALRLYGDKLGKDFIEEEYGETGREIKLRDVSLEKYFQNQEKLLKELSDKLDFLALKIDSIPEPPKETKNG